MIESIVEQSLLFFPLALGIYLSYCVLRIPDLTTDGSFLFGAAIFAIALKQGASPSAALAFASLAGGIAGMAVSLLQSRYQLNPLLAGIVLVFILNTVTLKMMGRPNLSLVGLPSLFSENKIGLLLPVALCLIGGIGFLLMSRTGLVLYALGNNPTLLNLSGKNAAFFRMMGLILSNGLVGLCGALTAQASGYVDIGMGTGIVLIALGTVIMGKQIYSALFKRAPYEKFVQLLFCFVGVILYFFIVNFFISMGLDPVYLRMAIGLCLVGFLVMAKEKIA